VRPRDIILVVAINFAWAFNVLAVKIAVTGLAPITAAFLRYGIVLVICLPFLKWVPGQMGRLFAAALSQGALWIALLNLGYAMASDVAGLSFVSQLGAVFSLILAVIFLGERIHIVRQAAIAISIAGVAVIGLDGKVLGEGTALWLCVAAAFMYSCGAILLRGLTVSPFTLFAWIGVTSAPLLAAASLIFEPGALAAVPELPWRTLAPVVYSALVASLVGHAGFAYLVQRYPVSTVTPLFLAAPLLGATVAVIFLGEPVTARLAIGGILILTGVAVISLRTPVRTAAA